MALASCVWGRTRVNESSTSKTTGIISSDDACEICRDSVAASVQFKPCGHRMCYNCVEKHRARSIFSADKGVKCPFCRRFIEVYVPVDGETSDVSRHLQDANKAAAAATAARSAHPEQRFPGDVMDICSYSDTQWRCLFCRCLNVDNGEECGNCARLKKEATVPPAPEGKDLSEYSAEDFVAACKVQWHPSLNVAFLKAGVPMVDGKATGTEEQILAALLAGRYQSLLLIINSLAASRCMNELSRHVFANYSLQDLLDAAAQLRAVADQASKALDPRISEDMLTNGGPFGVLYHELLDGVVESVFHPQACYVVQKVVALCSLDELLGVFYKLLPYAIDVTCDTKGAHVMLKMVEKLNTYCEGDERGKAQAAFDDLCHLFYNNFAWCIKLANTLHGGKVIIEAICGALPKYNGLRFGSHLASMAGDLVEDQYGRDIVMDLLSLEKPAARDILRDLVCCVAISLQGRIADHAVSESLQGQKLVGLLIERLAEENEGEWVKAIVRELICRGSNLLSSNQGFNLLSQALATEALDQDTVGDCLSWLEPQCSSAELADAVQYLRGDRSPVQRHRSQRPASLMNPYLKYKIENGYEIPCPPPPPQRPLDSSGAAVMENGLQAAKKDNTFNIDNDSYPAPSAAEQWLQNGFPKGLPTPPMPKPYLYDDSNVDQNRQSDCHQKPDFRTFSESSAHSLNHRGPTAMSLDKEQSSLWSCGSTTVGNMVASPLARLLWPAGVLPDTQVQTLNNAKPVKSSPESFTLSPGLKLHSVAEETHTQVVDPRIEATGNQAPQFSPWRCECCLYEHCGIETESLICCRCGSIKFKPCT